MSEEFTEEGPTGISRREALKRGAILGGAVVWATPVVQTVGMSRAFASTPSPVGGKDISYVGINATRDSDGKSYFIKYEDGSGWENKPGAAPGCADKADLPGGTDGGSLGFAISQLTSSCWKLTVPTGWVANSVWVKAGQTCNSYSNLGSGVHTVCSAV